MWTSNLTVNSELLADVLQKFYVEVRRENGNKKRRKLEAYFNIVVFRV